MAKRRISLAAAAITLAAGVIFAILVKSDDGEPVTELIRGRAKTSTASRAPSSAGAPDTGWDQWPDDAQGELSAADHAGLEGLCQGIITDSGIPDALGFLQSLPERPETSELLVEIVRQWAEHDPQAAADWAENLPLDAAKQECLNGVAIVWSNQDLEAAHNWAKRFPPGGARDEILHGIAYEAARTMPLTALEIAVDLPVSTNNDALIQHAALQWAAQSPEETADWAMDGIEDAPLRERILSQVATAWGDSDPVAAANLALSKIPPGKAQDDAVIGIVQRWVQTNPEAAENWVEAFPQGNLQDTARENMLHLRHDYPR